jgi:putative phosphoribosyl transferase
VVCLEAPPFFAAVGTWYDDFRHVPDADVASLLERAATAVRRTVPRSNPQSGGKQRSAPTAGRPERNESVEVRADSVALAGHIKIPVDATGLVVFVHGSGSSRHSPRNRFVAGQLNDVGFGTLLFDLLTPGEEVDRVNVFDIETLAGRLSAVTRWLRDQPEADQMPLGYFGASTGAAAALWTAAEPAAHVDAVVSRGGRPDLAQARLPAVRSPTLLIVGGEDTVTLGLNRAAQQYLRCENKLAIVPGATHLFEEPGALRTVTRLARDWFADWFSASDRQRSVRAQPRA